MLVSILVNARVLMRKFIGKTCTIRVLLQIKKLQKKIHFIKPRVVSVFIRFYGSGPIKQMINLVISL